MNICGQHGKHHRYFHTILGFTVLAIIFTMALKAAGLSGDQTGKHTFELRLASHQKVEGWEMVPGPGPEKTPVWISPEVALTNRDVARAYPSRTVENKPCVGIIFTEEGSLKMARLTKSHIGELLAIMIDGRVARAPAIEAEITGGRAIINGNFTEEETESIAKELSSNQTGKIKFELRLASHEKVNGWKSVPGSAWMKNNVWISPEVTLTNADLAKAWPEPYGGTFRVGLLLTAEGGLKLARLTKSHVGKSLAVMIDGQVVSAPGILAEINAGRAFIPCSLNEEEARSLAKGIMMK
jgi:preprotein translocase subunit SecD